MNTEIHSYQINELSKQLDRLYDSIDKICERVSKIEEEKIEQKMKFKLFRVLFFVYPLVIMMLSYSEVQDHRKEDSLYNEAHSALKLVAGSLITD